MGGQPKSNACGDTSSVARHVAQEPTEAIPQNQRDAVGILFTLGRGGGQVIPERLTTHICAITDRSRPYCANVRSGLPFSTRYVESAVLLPLLTFFAVCTVPAGTNKTSPAFSVTGV
jgi:hypothetical protein